MNNDQMFIRKNILLIAFVITTLLISLVIWLEHKESENLKFSLERERIGKAFRQAGSASEKMQPSLKPPNEEDDTIAPHELSDEGELAQAKLWQSLSKEKRGIMQAETTKAGLAAKSVSN